MGGYTHLRDRDSEKDFGEEVIDRQKLREQLKKHEGVRRYVYDDASGKNIAEGSFVRGLPTVGVGRNLVDRGLSDDEIDFLLDHDINDALADASKFAFFSKLDPVRKAAMAELVFNLGLTRLKEFKKFLGFMTEERWAHAAGELLNSKWARQVGERSITISEQIKKGEWQ
jgi:lysozyme